jgi:aldose 1-epimerase
MNLKTGKRTGESGLKKEKWAEIDGKEVWLFTLVNKNGTELRLSNYGATVQALSVANKNDIPTDVLLGYETVEEYVQDSFYMGSVVGRNANRISGTDVLIEGEKFTISANGNGYHLHGGQIGFNKKIWEVLPGRGLESEEIRMRYKSADGEEGFPGNLEVTVSYRLGANDEWVTEYQATTDKTTLINLTQHAYFNLAGHDAGSVEDHDLFIPATHFLPVNHIQVPTGEIRSVENTPFDFSSGHRIRDYIGDAEEQLQKSGGYDHSWVLEEKHSNRLKHAATVHAEKSGITLEVFTTEPAIHFYSGNFLNLVGKEHRLYAPRAGFCLETQHFPDTPNNPHFPSTILHPGEIFYSQTIFRFSSGKCSV